MPKSFLRFTRATHGHPVVRWLDEVFFPSVVRYMISRPHIVLLLVLIFALEYPSTPAVVMLMLGNYTNVISASSSAIVLRQQSNQHADVLEHHEAHADAFEQILERIARIEVHFGIAQEEPDHGS